MPAEMDRTARILASVGVGLALFLAALDQTFDELRDRAGAELQLLRNEPSAYRLVADHPQQTAALGRGHAALLRGVPCDAAETRHHHEHGASER